MEVLMKKSLKRQNRVLTSLLWEAGERAWYTVLEALAPELPITRLALF